MTKSNSAKNDVVLPPNLYHEEYWTGTSFQNWSVESFDIFWIQKNPSLYRRQDLAHSALGNELAILARASDKRIADKAYLLKKQLNFKNESSQINKIIWERSKDIAESQIHLTLSELQTKTNIETSLIEEINSSKRKIRHFKDHVLEQTKGDEYSDLHVPSSPTPFSSLQLLKEYSIAQSSYSSRLCFILKSGTIVKDLLDHIPHNSFWSGNHLILDKSNGWLLNGYMKLEDFEELVEICYSHGAVGLPIELKLMLKKLMKNHTRSHKSASIYYSLIDRLALQYFRTLRAGSSSESSLFALHEVDANLRAKQPDIYFRDDILKVEPGNVEIAKDGLIQDIVKYDLDTNKSLRENIYEIYYTYDNLPTSKKEKIFEMDFIAFVISDNHIDTYVTRLVDNQLYISTKLRMNQTVETMRKAKMDDADPLIDSPKKFTYFYDPRILPSVISKKKSSDKKKNTKKN
ncbi:4658_t:CDS:2 [Entrophospora sp. SA101]|nr:4658_t:CDS:2 [Entrophospora sp. SA101]CAJ0912905.1 17930_t:CDS:2 [Entrophospora sp. SA101]